MTAPGQAQGESVNLGSIHDTSRQLNVEASPGGASVLELRATPRATSGGAGDGAAWFFHTNVYRHLQWGDAYAASSSWHRLQRLSQLARPTGTDGMRAALSDTADADFPVYRNGTSPDSAVTLNAVVFDLVAGEARVWVYWDGRVWGYHPTAADAPAMMTLPLRGGGHDAWVRAARAAA